MKAVRPQKSTGPIRPVRRILVAHNRYRQAGGEDTVFANETALLRDAGLAVETLVVDNDGIEGALSSARAAIGVVSNPAGRRAMADAIHQFRPDVVHVHNFFPRLSPAVFDACHAAGVASVWTLHNFRITCANGLLFRDGRPCEDCVGRAPIPAVLHRCYRGSRAGSAAVAGMIAYHQYRRTWHEKVNRFIVLSAFARDIAVRAGVPASRIAVKPNFVPDPGMPRDGSRNGAVYVGRLSKEKGVDVLIEAWRALPHVPLTIVGDGPERARLEATAPQCVSFLGHLDRDGVLSEILRSRTLVIPSICYESFGMVAAEAMALGTPVIASRIGALAELVRDDQNGVHFHANDPADLARVAVEAFSSPGRLAALGEGARQHWEAEMAPQRNLAMLLDIYASAWEAP